ncbi:hypothetical protein SUGI_0537300 [Cryptomeria japonica]|uniref:homeobox-leucine zipper protein HOX17 n=1 Tax=Cryptomeria japonica TaxID=3369 RepID=UPI002408B6A9|nr:homeobox-leucine zipper protein HOX17 [Cryptomeria japonica]GLJ27375.1 hypothetical protein SUGI_0537300 [Cryptomeria japonica]
MEVMDAVNQDCDTTLGLGIRIGISGQSDGDPSVPIELDLLPLAPIPRHSAVSEVFQCTKSLSEQEIIDVNKLPLVTSCSTSTQHDNIVSSSPHREGSYGVGIKRERCGLMEEGCCKVSEEEAESGGTRKKLKLSRDQSALLEESFRENSTLNTKQKQALAKKLNLRSRQVEVWFQNRRARTKLKQTEVDCEFLKKCYETLREENRRLLKELAQLRSVKVAASSPLYMQLPRAALSMCPSCQRVVTSDNTMPFAPLPNPHFYTSYKHSSVSC